MHLTQRLQLIEEPRSPRSVFPHSSLTIERRYIPVNRFVKSLNDLEILLRNLDVLHVVPPEAPAALRRLARGDYKQFSEIHIEANVCPQIISSCRETGPRIVYAITRDDQFLELYSECFDPELVLVAMLGDLARIIPYEIGYRDLVRFKRALVPTFLLEEETIDRIERLAERSTTLDLRARTLSEAIEAIKQLGNEISELIITIPCLNQELLEELVPVLRELVESGTYVVFLTRPPHEADVSCYETVTRYLLLYLEVMSELNENGVRACYSSVTETSIIVDRSVVVTTYENRYVPQAGVVCVSDPLYAQNLALVHLRNCICTSHLVKEDRR